jgi:hypothetical protein
VIPYAGFQFKGASNRKKFINIERDEEVKLDSDEEELNNLAQDFNKKTIVSDKNKV